MIYLDVPKIYKEYAEALTKTVEQLTTKEKQQCILNAVLKETEPNAKQ